MNTIRIYLSLFTPNFDWVMLQFDVKIAFLHVDLEEEIYMTIPRNLVENMIGNKLLVM